MAKYAITKYNADPARIYIMGGSGGAMLVQAMLAVYPDVFRAGAARAGVPAGCWADGYDPACSGATTVRAATRSRRRSNGAISFARCIPATRGTARAFRRIQGDADTTVSYKNTGESIKEWTNVMMLSTAPTSTDMGYKAQIATYNRQFWANSCNYVVFQAWTSPGGTHSMGYEEDDMLDFFGLKTAGTPDPEPDCNGTGGSGGAAGAGGMSAGGTGAGGLSSGGMSSGGTGVQGGNGGTAGGLPSLRVPAASQRAAVAAVRARAQAADPAEHQASAAIRSPV